MNLKFLGDALDHWKGCLFESLRAAQALRNFAVDPMTTDSGSWKPEDFSLLARLLRVDGSDLILHRTTLEDRTGYFGEIRHTGDLFLDPDIGVATGPATKGVRYIAPAEIRQLLDSSPERLLIVYQHVRAQKVAKRVGKVISTLENQIGGFN